MLFQHVAIAGLAHIDAPRRLTSDEIHARLKPTMDRLGIKANVLQDVAGVNERRLWDGEVLKNFPGRGQWVARKRPESLRIKR